MPPAPVRFAAGALLGVLVLYPGARSEAAGAQVVILTLGALAFGAWSLRRAGRFWERVARLLGSR